MEYRSASAFHLLVSVLVMLYGCQSKDNSKGNARDSVSVPETIREAEAKDSAQQNQPIDSEYQLTVYPTVVPLPEADTVMIESLPIRAVVKDGEIWTTDTIAGTSKQLTFTHGQMRKLYPSPTGRYVVGYRLVDQIESGGIYEEGEKVPLLPIYDLVMIDLYKGGVIRELSAPEDTFVSLHEWYSNSRAILICSDEFAANAFYLYDAFRDSLQKVRYGFGRN